MRLERLELSRSDGVARLRLSGSALGAREASELAGAAEDLALDGSLRVVVLESRGPSFCPGADADLDPLALDPVAALAALRTPLVASLRGETSSVGLEIALAADIRVASPDASFAVREVALGRLPCWGATQRLPRVVGAPRALSMLLLGETLDAAAALSAGLVQQVVDDPVRRVEEITAALLALAPLALEYAKEAVHRGAELPMREALRLEGDFNHLLQGSADRAEGLSAFFEKRSARFTGR